MEYFAGLDVSMEETHVCVLDRDGVLIREGKAVKTSPPNRTLKLSQYPFSQGERVSSQ